MQSTDEKTNDSKNEDEQFCIEDVSSVKLIDCGNYYMLPSNLDPDKDKNIIKIVCISDTHGKHQELLIKNLPSADILCHAGDFTMYGKLSEIESYDKWIQHLLKEKKYEYSILIAGNHDITLEEEYYNNIGYINHHEGKKENVAQCIKIAKHGHSIYIENESVELLGVTFYGSPYQPEFCEWAFNKARGKELEAEWAKIPENGIDVLLTHGPPQFHGDKVVPQFSLNSKANYYGCYDLLKRVHTLENIQYHIFGHIHQGFGVTKHKGISTQFVNASSLNSNYFMVNKPIMLYVKGNRIKEKQQEKDM